MSFACQNCELHKTKGPCYVQGIGNVGADVVFIGEAPSDRDTLKGIPFSGRDKEILDRLLATIGLSRKQVFTTNLVQCRPPLDAKGFPTKAAPEHFDACWANLDHELSTVKPKVVVLFGAEAAKSFLGARTLGSVAGRVYDSADCRGLGFALSGETKEVTKAKAKVTVPLNRAGAFKVIATYSPLNTLRDPSVLGDVERAFQTVKRLLAGETEEKRTYNYRFAYTEPEVYAALQDVLKRADVMHAMEPNGAMSFDIETSGFNWYARMFGSGHVSKTLACGFSFRPYEATAVSLRDKVRSARVVEAFKAILAHPVRKCGHNGKFDNVFLRGEFGVRVVNYAFDTMIAAYHLNQEAEVGLAKLSPVYRPDLGYYWEGFEKQWLNKTADGKRNGEIGYLCAPDDELLLYNCRDVDATQTLYQVFSEDLKAWAHEAFYAISMPHSLVLEDMEFYGVKLDVDKCIALGRTTAVTVKEKEREALAAVGRHPHWWGKDCEKHGVKPEDFKPFNIASTKQLGELLFGELKLPVINKSQKTGAASVDEETLVALKDKHALIPILMEYRKAKKFLSTYLGWEVNDDGTEGPMTTGSSLLALVGADGRLRPSFHITGTGTGRLSCSGPNLQNQPKTPEFRSLFTSEDGWKLADCDFAALELRVVALLAQDEAMIQIFKDGIDPHSATASKMFGIPIEQVDKNGKQRKAAKAINFGIVYGQGAAALAASLDVTEDEAEKWLKDWGKAYPGITRFINAKHAEVRKHGYVQYSLGRRRPLPAIFSDNKGEQGGAERASVNTPVQGTGADCTSLSAIRIRDRVLAELGADNVRMVLEIHDQIVAEFREGLEDKVKAIFLEEMRRQMPFLPDLLPLDADFQVKKSLGDKDQ
jgi:DNA polymerase-1